MSNKTFFLTGDIGGTNSRMAFYEAVGENKLLVEHTYRNAHCIPDKPTESSYQDCIIVPFLERCFLERNLNRYDDSINIIACLACAGPVMHNCVMMSNLNDCVIDGRVIQGSREGDFLSKIQYCQLINDFVAQGYGCLTLKLEEMRHLHGPEFTHSAAGPKVCVGAGTGLGECYLTPDNDGVYTCYPSEGGHTEFSPRTKVEGEMLDYLREKFDKEHSARISVERVVSGIGLANVFDFLINRFPEKANKAIVEEYKEAGDMAAKVVAINTDKDELCQQAMDIMMSAYGCEVGCAALKFIPTGGLFVTGGLTPKNIHHIEPKDSKFLESYKDKGRVSPILELIPTYAIMVEDLGVRGALQCAKMAKDRLSRRGTVAKSNNSGGVGSLPIIVVTGVVAFAAGLYFSRAK